MCLYVYMFSFMLSVNVWYVLYVSSFLLSQYVFRKYTCACPVLSELVWFVAERLCYLICFYVRFLVSSWKYVLKFQNNTTLKSLRSARHLLSISCLCKKTKATLWVHVNIECHYSCLCTVHFFLSGKHCFNCFCIWRKYVCS